MDPVWEEEDQEEQDETTASWTDTLPRDLLDALDQEADLEASDGASVLLSRSASESSAGSCLAPCSSTDEGGIPQKEEFITPEKVMDKMGLEPAIRKLVVGVMEAYPELDLMMAETCVNAWLKHPDCSDPLELVKDVPKDFSFFSDRSHEAPPIEEDAEPSIPADLGVQVGSPGAEDPCL